MNEVEAYAKLYGQLAKCVPHFHKKVRRWHGEWVLLGRPRKLAERMIRMYENVKV